METDPVRRRSILVGLGAIATVIVVGGGWLLGAPAAIGSWFREVSADTAYLPENNPENLLECAQFYDHSGNNAYALAAARRAVMLSPNFVPARKFLATKALKDNDFTEAAAQCQAVLQTSPGDSSARLGLATAYQGLGNNDAAASIFGDMANNDSYDPAARDTARRALNLMKSNTAASR